MYPDIHMGKAPTPSRLWSMNLFVWHAFPSERSHCVGRLNAPRSHGPAVSAIAQSKFRFVYIAAEGYGRLLSSPYGDNAGGSMASGQTSSDSIGNPPRPS